MYFQFRSSILNLLILGVLGYGSVEVCLSPLWAQSDISIVDDRSVHVPDEYEVEEGDSLWLISQEFFNDPWLWPNLWALNPHITNPHWIYPGDLIRLKWHSTQVGASKSEEFNLQPIGYSANLQKIAQRVINKGLILEKDQSSLGQIIASPEPKSYLAQGDDVYLKIDQPDQIRLGQNLSIYRKGNMIYHPDTQEVVGQKILLMGTIEVTEKGLKDTFLKGRIIRSHQEIQRGDLLVQQTQTQIEINPIKNALNLNGVILDGLSELSEFGQHNVVFLNLGTKDGVMVGNRLSVVRRGDGIESLSKEMDDKMPLEPIGEILVIATQEKTATALITRARFELRRGDEVLMLRNY